MIVGDYGEAPFDTDWLNQLKLTVSDIYDMHKKNSEYPEEEYDEDPNTWNLYTLSGYCFREISREIIDEYHAAGEDMGDGFTLDKRASNTMLRPDMVVGLTRPSEPST